MEKQPRLSKASNFWSNQLTDSSFMTAFGEQIAFVIFGAALPL
jgi:hypothetical protein